VVFGEGVGDEEEAGGTCSAEEGDVFGSHVWGSAGFWDSWVMKVWILLFEGMPTLADTRIYIFGPAFGLQSSLGAEMHRNSYVGCKLQGLMLSLVDRNLHLCYLLDPSL
jgi:hypothetical protein